jgi:hypothetical protein
LKIENILLEFELQANVIVKNGKNYSINGQLVHSISKQSTNGEQIDLSNLNKGLYLLELLLDGEKLGTH